MGNAVTVRGRLADPHHVELDEAVTDLSGPLEVVLRAAREVLRPADRVATARALQAASQPQRTDSVTLLREDRDR